MRLLLALSFFICLPSYGQDASRTFIKTLCAPNMWGRGYVNGGDSIAGDFISSEFKSIGLDPFGNSYQQNFEFPVNTFPTNMEVVLNERSLKPGIHFVVDPSSKGFSGELNLKTGSISELYNQNLILKNWPKNSVQN
mgnify:CR=1 FL=1